MGAGSCRIGLSPSCLKYLAHGVGTRWNTEAVLTVGISCLTQVDRVAHIIGAGEVDGPALKWISGIFTDVTIAVHIFILMAALGGILEVTEVVISVHIFPVKALLVVTYGGVGLSPSCL